MQLLCEEFSENWMDRTARIIIPPRADLLPRGGVVAEGRMIEGPLHKLDEWNRPALLNFITNKGDQFDFRHSFHSTGKAWKNQHGRSLQARRSRIKHLFLQAFKFNVSSKNDIITNNDHFIPSLPFVNLQRSPRRGRPPS